MVTYLKPYNPSASDLDLTSDWHVIDASGEVLGRLATRAAQMLMGKHKPGYVANLLSGDFVIVVNAAQIKVTGRKSEQKVYRRHSQYPGHLKEIPYERVLSKTPERIIEQAVKGMLPKNKLGDRMLNRLKVYAGPEHPHEAQIKGMLNRHQAVAAARDDVEPAAPSRRKRRTSAVERKKAQAAPAAAAAAPEEAPEPEVTSSVAPVEAAVGAPEAVAQEPVPADVARETAATDESPAGSEVAAEVPEAAEQTTGPGEEPKVAARTPSPSTEGADGSTEAEESTGKAEASAAGYESGEQEKKPRRRSTARKTDTADEPEKAT